MGVVGVRLWLCLLIGFAIICSARNTNSVSGFTGDEVTLLVEAMEGRSLRVSLDDYGEASANHGHDPKTKEGGGGGSNGGGKSRDNP